MDNNFICSWILFYTQSNAKFPQLNEIAEVELDYHLKRLLCSSVPYVECAKRFNFYLSKNETGFNAIFNYFANHKGRIMDKLKDEDQELFINSLMNCDHFSMKHHLSLIKCFMKAYVCELAPLGRIRRSFVAMGCTTNIDRDDETFRNIQKNLSIWIVNAATKGLQKLTQKSNKELTESDILKFINTSCLTSQLVYCMFYYVQTKMMQFSIIVPDVDIILSQGSPNQEMIKNHVNITTRVFSEVCDNQDAFPIQTDTLCSTSLNNVPVTLTIALVFHWIFGNSLKSLENLLKTSSNDLSSTNTGKSHSRPTNIFINTNSDKLKENATPKVFFLATNLPSDNAGLNQLFLSKKTSKEKNLLLDNKNENKISSDDDTSPEIFLTPTEESAVTFLTQNVVPTKLLSENSTLSSTPASMLVKDQVVEPMSISLKEEFKKKQQNKTNFQKNKVKVVSVNETTWIDQKNKNESIQIPITPKKSVKSLSSPQSDNQNITKAQLNELQIRLGLQKQKIQNNMKKNVVKTERNIVNFKQKAFFQVLNNRNTPQRRHSTESDDITDKYCSDGSLDKSVSMNNIKTLSTLPNSNDNKFLPTLIEKREIQDYEEKIDGIEIPCSLQESDVALSPVHISQEQIIDMPYEGNRSPIKLTHSTLNNIPEIPLLEETSISRKNSSTSVSSLSSNSTKSSDRLLLNQQEYYKSMDVLNKSLTTLQNEIRVLSEQQRTLNNRFIPNTTINQIKPDVIEGVDHSVDNNSVPETPTNNISITEVSEIPTPNEKSSSLIIADVENILPALIPSEASENNLLLSSELLKANEPTDSLDNINMIDSISVNKNDTEIEKNHQEKSFTESASNVNEENNNLSISQSFTDSSTDEEIADMASSTDSSSIVSSNPPITFVIETNQEVEEAQKRKAELLALREEKRRKQMDLLRQKRDKERENRLSATVDELMEREEKKRLEKEKRDSLLQKYLDRKKNENSLTSMNLSTTSLTRSASAANTPVKIRTNPRRQQPVLSVKQDSVGDIPLASSLRSTWFSSMRNSHRSTSQSTSKLDDSSKFGVPLPPQEYTGPRLFGKRKVKTNRSVIINAISHCCLAGSVNESLKESVLKELADAEGTHFMILFRDARCQYRAIYSFNLASDELNVICGSGPKKICHEMVEKFYKYNSGAKQFNLILSTKHLSPAVDAICIQSQYWNPKSGSQMLQNSLSSINIDQSKSKRNLKNVSITN